MSQAQNCPPPANQAEVTVQPHVRFLPDERSFRYRYTVTNQPESPQRVTTFAVDVLSPFEDVVDPPTPPGAESDRQWHHNTIRKRNYRSLAVQWVGLGEKDQSTQVADPSRMPPPVTGHIEPGETVEGFGFETSHPPGFASFYALGLVQVNRTGSGGRAGRLSSDCPKSSVGPFFDRAGEGTTVGPGEGLRATVVVAPGSDTNVLDPDSQGTVPVALLGSDTVPVRRASRTQALFGITMTKPARPGQIRDLNRDGHDDLLFHFPVQETGIDSGHPTPALSVGLSDPFWRGGTHYSVAWGTVRLRIIRPPKLKNVEPPGIRGITDGGTEGIK